MKWCRPVFFLEWNKRTEEFNYEKMLAIDSLYRFQATLAMGCSELTWLGNMLKYIANLF
jgi:hypothetical protein